MDWIMDWQLLYRTVEEVRAFLIDGPGGGHVTTFRDPHPNAIYAEWTDPSAPQPDAANLSSAALNIAS